MKEENNFRKEILVQRWIRESTNLDIYEREVYSMFIRKTVGYGQTTTRLLSYKNMADYCKLSLSTIKRVVPKLIESKYIIKLATNIVANSGKLPYRYQLNFKLPGFPSLGNLTKQDGQSMSEPVYDDRVNLYFITDAGIILPLYNSLDSTKGFTSEWIEYSGSNSSISIVHPTTKQLLKYLKE